MGARPEIESGYGFKIHDRESIDFKSTKDLDYRVFINQGCFDKAVAALNTVTLLKISEQDIEALNRENRYEAPKKVEVMPAGLIKILDRI